MTEPGRVHDSYCAPGRGRRSEAEDEGEREAPPDFFSSKARPDQAKVNPGGSTSRATSSIAAIACPELYVVAAFPFTFAAGKPLNGKEFGPDTQRVFTRAESAPSRRRRTGVEPRQVPGCCRYFGSDWRTTTRPAVLVELADGQRSELGLDRAVDVLDGDPMRFALSRSTSAASCCVSRGRWC